jgi:NAD(P)-dependent dehydrogenase (short-subunit alcohol dehydrogenase family)
MRTVVVGASSGLGRRIALGPAERGAVVAPLARRRDRLGKTRRRDRSRDLGTYAAAGVDRLPVRPWSRLRQAIGRIRRFSDEVLHPLREPT